eukprot:352980-Chlamydomonas_euryale.AAC.3
MSTACQAAAPHQPASWVGSGSRPNSWGDRPSLPTSPHAHTQNQYAWRQACLEARALGYSPRWTVRLQGSGMGHRATGVGGARGGLATVAGAERPAPRETGAPKACGGAREVRKEPGPYVLRQVWGSVGTHQARAHGRTKGKV